MLLAKDRAISLDMILTMAERESGGYDLIDQGLRRRVAVMIDRINARGPFTPDRSEDIRRQIHAMLVNRLRIAGDRRRFAGIAAEPIQRPIFIVGFGRSGTTLLHSLLAEDPEVLALRSWHMYSPSPPPGAGPVAAGRIAFAQRALEAWIDFCPGQQTMHPYIDKGAYQLIEDEELFSLDFRNLYPYHFYKIPSAEIDVVLDTDQAGAFSFHRDMLQHLQWNRGKSRWICKGASAPHHLDALFKVYPDAVCVWPHRPIGEIYASNVALRAVLYDTVSGRPNDWSSQARQFAERMKASLDRLMASALIDDPRVMHMSFRDVAADPFAAVQAIYEFADRAVTPAFADGVKRWLADTENRVDRYGRYPYSYAAFGLDRQWVDELFADYSERFGLTGKA